jgi:hypothetical protein
MNIFIKHKEIHNFIWEARGHKSITEYFITNLYTQKVNLRLNNIKQMKQMLRNNEKTYKTS